MYEEVVLVDIYLPKYIPASKGYFPVCYGVFTVILFKVR